MTALDAGSSRVANGLKFLLWPFLALRWLIHQIFGELFWRPPHWAECAGRGVGVAAGCARRHPVLAIGGVAVLVALVVGWVWWEAQPKPVTVVLTVTNPGYTDLEFEEPRVDLLRIAFSVPVAALEGVDKEVAGESITASPALKGKWKWEGDTVLTLLPETDWPVGGEYTVTFSPKIFRPEARFDSYKTTFQSPRFEARALDARFDQDPTDPKSKKVVATINFTHPVDAADFEKRVSLVMEGQGKGLFGLSERKTDFQVSFDKKKLNAYIHSALLPIPEKSQVMRVTVDKGVRAAAGGNVTSETLTAMASVPGIDGLRISGIEPKVVVDEKFQPEQVLILQPSMLVQEQQAKGAVKVWLLPEQPPDGYLQSDQWGSNRRYLWSNRDVARIDSTLLKSSEVVKLEVLPSENDVADTFSYRYQAPPGRYLYVQVPKGLTAFGGYRLGNDVARVFKVPPYPAVAQIMSEGSLLSLSGERKLSVIARDVPAIRYSIGRVLPQQLQHLVNKGLSYNDFSKPEVYHDLESDVVERFEKIIELPALAPGKPQYQALDLTEYLGQSGKARRGIFLLHVQAYDPKTKWVVGKRDSRLVMVSDLGLIEKQTVDGHHDFFVQSIYRGGPVADAVIEVIGRNGLPVMRAKTNVNGHAMFPQLDDFRNEREPVFFLVSKDDDSSFLPYSRYNRFGRHLNYSRFDVGGAVNAVESRQLSAYLFSDRGIYRPGEEIRVGMVVRATDWAQSVAGIPLELEVIDARGLTVRRDKIVLSESGFGELRHATLDTAPAGTYTINLSLIKKGRTDTLIGSTTVRVQDFEPDRLRMSVRFNQGPTEGWVTPDDLAVQVSLQNLFATPAENRRVRGFLSLSPGVLKFPRYKDYLFDDPQRAKEPASEELSETATDIQGMATLSLDLQRFARATYRAHVVVQGFEADGGRGVSGEATMLVSGLDYLVGYKPDGKLEFVRRDSARAVDLLAIGRDGKQRAVEGLKLQHVERRFVSVLIKQHDGTYRYQSKEKEILLDEKPLTVAAVGYSLKLATETPGAFSYVVRDAEGLEYAKIHYSVAGEANLTRSLDKNAELKLTLSKGDFTPGEEIEVQIEAPYTGNGLITIERDRVYAYRWFSSKTTSTVQKIWLPEDVDGNAYLTVTFVRDLGSDEIYMSPLSYGVTPFSVSRERYQLKLDVAAPEKIKPGETVTFKVKSDKAAKAVVFAVDEGILQVARHKTADPLGYFFQKRALEVSTSQLLDLILPEFSRVMASAPGGDGEGALGRFLNPFKRKRDLAVAYWSGIVDVGPNGKTLSWQVPESFNGSLRVMAVAVASQTVGVYEGYTVVRGDFVLSPNAPLTVTPGDEFDVPVSVSNHLENSGSNAKVKVTLDAGEHFEVLGDKTIEALVPENREGVVHFRVRAKPLLGSGTLSLAAGIGDRIARLATAVSVRPATPYRQELQVGTVAIGKEAEISTARRLFTDHRKLNVGVSSSPLVLTDGLVSYLEQFPYSCTEQIVSQAIPALVLSHRPEFGEIKAKRDTTLAGLIATLRGRQNAEGAYGLWAANAVVSEPASVWVQQFLVEAKDRGDVVPNDMLQRGNEWLQNLALSEGSTLYADRTRAHAVYVLTRQGIQTSAFAAAIQKRLETRDTKTWKNDSAAVYLAATYKMLKQDRLADDVLSDFRFNTSVESKKTAERGDPLGGARDNGWWLCDDLCRDAGALYLLARHLPERAKKLPENAFTAMLIALSMYQNTTFSSAQLLLALDAWTGLAETSGSAKFRVNEILRDKATRELVLSKGLVQRAPFAPETAKLAVRNQSDMMGFYMVEASGFDVEPPAGDLREGVEILREYTDASGKPLMSVTQGDEVYVRLKFRGLNHSFSGIGMAVVDLLPGGFDLVLNPSNAEANSNESQQALRRDMSSRDDSENGDGYYRDEDEERWTAPFGNSPTNWNVEYADMREDRIVLYGILEAKTHEFVYKIRATNVGTYTLPPAYAEGLYRRDVRARSLPGGKLIVVPVAKK
ncbi:MAG: alpha-2-macroglobulin family protein [Burkholderiales bacterium]|jgi:uncharacterized protein YfaS (alpha-2-macroglobulin family)|nr:alpha-2-macroglobulin family protein [Burkholderiales bacterium]